MTCVTMLYVKTESCESSDVAYVRVVTCVRIVTCVRVVT